MAESNKDMEMTSGSLDVVEKEAADAMAEGGTFYWMRWSIPRLVTLIFFALLLAWIYMAEGGIGTTFLTVFGLHALLMAMFVLIFLQESVLTLAVPLLEPCARGNPNFQRCAKSRSYLVVLNVCGMLCWIGGIVAIVSYKRLSPQPVDFPFYTMYSPHSWLAVCVIICWFAKFITNVFLSAATVKWYRFWSRAVYGMALATCALGLQDMQSSDLAGSTPPYVSTANFTQDMIDDMGYYPGSGLARQSSFAVILLFVQAVATFWTQV